MSGLVGYGSSDEEENVQVERPAKVAKIDLDSNTSRNPMSNEPEPTKDSIPEATAPPTAEPQGPLAPSEPPANATDTPTSAPQSPYTFERQRIRDLTMPTAPDFEIPDSPPPPSDPDDIAALAATTKKFNRFLDLKKTGTHFNARLQSTASLRNPSLLPKLMDFAGLSQEDSYASSLPVEAGGVPSRWPEQCYVENLVKENERREKKRMKDREKVDFVPAAKSTNSSATGTPKNGGEQHRKSRFDKR